MFLNLLFCAAVFYFSTVHSLAKDLSRSKRSDTFVQCDSGWFQFREKCLKVYGRLRSQWGKWQEASAHCKKEGGTLVTIQSQEELDFILTFLLLDASATLWLGLNRLGDLKEFAWEDGSPVNYTNWYDKEPSNHPEEKCAVMSFDPSKGNVGRWNDRECRDSYAMMCQKRTDRRKRSQDPRYCSDAEGGGWKYHESCFHLVQEPKNWKDAEKHCKDQYNGHLATVLDVAVDLYLDRLFPNNDADMWIGLKMSNEELQKWTSGWFVSYNRTGNAVRRTCVLRKSSQLWTTVPCFNRHPFICETSSVLPPVLDPPPKGSLCPEFPNDWIDLGGEYCYFFEIDPEKALKWSEANFECNRRGGDLLSIHGSEVADIIQPFVKYATTGLFIGLLRQKSREDVFIWTDGSDVDYVKWLPWEPNHPDEKCGEVSGHSMEWNDVWCEVKRAYICAVKKVTPNAEVDESAEYECGAVCYIKKIFKTITFH